MSIDFTCSCGRALHAKDGTAGRRVACPHCGSVLTIPSPAADGLYDLAPSPSVPAGAAAAPAAPAAPAQPMAVRTAPVARASSYAQMVPALHAGPSPWRRYLYLIWLLTLLPLVIHTFQKPVEFVDQLNQTIAEHRDIADLPERIVNTVKRVEAGEVNEEAVFSELPNHRLSGALLARDSKAHWAFALAAAGGFYLLLLLMYGGSQTKALSLFLAGLCTATIGIVLLLAFQFAASATQGVWIRGGRAAIIFYIIKLIGWGYRAADDPANGFALSFFAFTISVGLCEEVTKALPMLFRVRSIPGEESPTWRALMLWGLASGVGFGVAEGIMYSGDYYNGMGGPSIYLVRFISCVGLHAIWAASVGLTLYNRQSWLEDAESGWHYCAYIVGIVAIPMVLHGLYDTLLKQDYNVLALLVAIASFGWLAFQIESMQRKLPDTPPAVA